MIDENTCPACKAGDVFRFFTRGRVPVFQNWPLDSKLAAQQVSRGDLSFYACEQCGFIFNKAFDPAMIIYGEHYDNSQQHSGYFSEYMTGLVNHLVDECGIKNSTIVEVGCGKGAFLEALISREDAHNTGIGFDTSYQGEKQLLGGRLKFESSYYDKNAGYEPDVLISRHVIEHVNDPAGFLQSIRESMDSVPHARLFIETPCVEWILRNGVIWDFFYEHCSLFTAESLASLVMASGFSVQSVKHLFGGQYLWLEATVGDRNVVPQYEPGEIPSLARKYEMFEKAYEDDWHGRMDEFKARGAVSLWGAGAKGVTFANMLDPECRHISCIVDVNENKQGKFLPGTGHPIVSPDVLGRLGVKTTVLMNPNYRDEVERILLKEGLDIELVC